MMKDEEETVEERAGAGMVDGAGAEDVIGL